MTRCAGVPQRHSAVAVGHRCTRGVFIFNIAAMRTLNGKRNRTAPAEAGVVSVLCGGMREATGACVSAVLVGALACVNAAIG